MPLPPAWDTSERRALLHGATVGGVGWAQLEAWVSNPSRAGVLVDFDGTLAPIVDDPAEARALAGGPEALAALADRYRLVAVVSGRPAAFLAGHLDVPRLERWGSYGLEHVLANGTVEVAPEAEPWRAVVETVVHRALRQAPPGVGVEDKGISVTLHVRSAPEQARWARHFAGAEQARTGLAVHDARMSIELRPPLSVDKGTIVRRLVERAGVDAACFIGDDRGDLAAFGALDDVPRALRVAVRSDESPPELLAAADLVVDGPEGVLDLLRALAPRC